MYNFTRGSKKVALEAAKDDERMKKARQAYEDDWASKGGTGENYAATWIELHEAHWDGRRRPALPPIPLSAESIHVIGSLLKLGHYRSSKNYIHIYHADQAH